MRYLRHALAVLVLVAVSAVSAWMLLATPLRAQQDDQGALAGLISRLLSTPTTRVTIGGVEGALSSNAVITDVQILDDEGVWLRLDRAEIVWSRTALLLNRRLQVDSLRVGTLEYLRQPERDAVDEAAAEPGPILPELPVEVRIDEFVLEELVLGEPILGTAARLSAEGSASLGDPSDGLDLTFSAQRLDEPGSLGISLNYVPETNQLAVELTHDEPAGGIAARLLDLPGLPPVQLQLAGEGPLTDFAATLDFTAGPTIGAEGSVRVVTENGAYVTDLDIAARLAGLLPPTVAPVFAGVTQVAGLATVGEDGSLILDGLNMTTPVAALTLTGTVSADRVLDVSLSAASVPNELGITRVGTVELEELLVQMAVAGPLTAPRLDGSIEASGVSTPEGRFEDLNVVIASAPVGDAAEPESFTIEVDGTLDGIALVDEALGRAIGDSINIVARGTVDLDGVADIAQARIMTPTMAANFAGRIGTDVIDGNLSAAIADLRPFSGLAAMPLRGSAEIDARLAGDPSISQVVAQLQGTLREFESGSEALNGLIGDTLTLDGSVARVIGGVSFDDLRLRGANLDVVLNGRADEELADIGLDLTIPDLSALDERIAAGSLTADARITGTIDAPDFAGDVTIENAQALDRAIPRLTLGVEATDITGLFVADIALDGEVAGNPASGTGRVSRRAEGGYAVEGLDLRIGSVVLAGDLGIGDAGLSQGQISLTAGELDDLSPLLLTRLRGALDARLILDIVEGGQNARITADGSQLRFEDITLTDFVANVAVEDLYRAPVIDGVVEANTLAVAGQTFSQIRLAADGSEEQTNFTASAQAQAFDLAAQGTLSSTEDDIRIGLTQFSATRGARTLSLISPASFVIDNGVVTIAGLVLQANGGQISVAGQAGEQLDLSLVISALPLSIAEIAAPGLGLTGTAEGRATITGTPADPRGNYEVTLSNVSLPQLADAGLPALDARATGTIADQRATVDATITAANLNLAVTGSAPLDPDGALALNASGQVDLAVANVVLAPEGRRLIGAASVDATITGPLADPQLAGALSVQNARFTDEVLGLDITGITARITADGQVLRIEAFSAATPNGGTLSAAGQVRIDPQANFPGEITITGRRAQLVASDLATAIADLDLSISGPLATSPLIAGRVELITLDIAVPDRIPTTLQPLPNSRHIDPPPQAQARLAIRQERRERRAAGPRFDARLDLTIIAVNRIFVRGRGINAELGGELRLTGTTMNPVAIGSFELRRGRFDLLGQRLDFTRGRIDFTGDFTPTLDFVAETQASDVTAAIIVSGPASDPTFELTSSPELPQDEILSRILFDRAAGGLSAGQALQLAQGIATLAGTGGPGVFENLRRSLGVDSLDIAIGEGGPAVGVSRYIADNVRLGVRAGARPEDTGVSVDIDLSRRLRLQGQVGADGRSSVGIGYEIEY